LFAFKPSRRAERGKATLPARPEAGPRDAAP
jgi:hypothetical protein